jgi:hypothetical protein
MRPVQKVIEGVERGQYPHLMRLSASGHQRHFEGELVTSALPSTPDVLLFRNKRRLRPSAEVALES